LALPLALAVYCHAAVTGFVANPTTNSSDFAAWVASNGGTLNTSINFDAHPIGALQANFYSALGVTLGGTGDFTSVQNGAGPAQSNTTSPPLSSGEGLHAVSNFVGGTTQAGTFTVSFASPVSAVGLFTVDLFNPSGANNVTIQIYDAPNGTGTLLGTFTAAAYNLQPNHLYFMGAASTSNNIRSMVFTNAGGGGDVLGLDNVEFATSGSVTTIPAVPTLTTWGLVLLGLALMVFGGRKLATASSR